MAHTASPDRGSQSRSRSDTFASFIKTHPIVGVPVRGRARNKWRTGFAGSASTRRSSNMRARILRGSSGPIISGLRATHTKVPIAVTGVVLVQAGGITRSDSFIPITTTRPPPTAASVRTATRAPCGRPSTFRLSGRTNTNTRPITRSKCASIRSNPTFAHQLICPLRIRICRISMPPGHLRGPPASVLTRMTTQPTSGHLTIHRRTCIIGALVKDPRKHHPRKDFAAHPLMGRPSQLRSLISCTWSRHACNKNASSCASN